VDTARHRPLLPTSGRHATRAGGSGRARGYPDEVAPSDWYQQLHDAGLDYGPYFQGVEQLWRGRGEALVQLRAPNGLPAAPGDSHLHPALLDACSQVVRGAVSEGPPFFYKSI
jgi:acyl transferase domain-containing protein